MKKKLSPEKLIVIVGIIFATVLVLVNVFFDFVPHTVKTENINATATTEFSTYYNQNVNKKDLYNYPKSNCKYKYCIGSGTLHHKNDW